VLVHDRSLLEDARLLEGVSAAARLALENARLHAELRAQLLELRASRARIVAAGDEASRRIERNLHDGAQQRLLGIRLALRLAGSQPASHGTAELLAEVDEEVQATLDELRSLARGIHPAVLSEEGLGPALRALARRAAVPVELGDLDDERLPAPVETAAYYVAAEALANAAKHAGASRVQVRVARTDDGRAAIEVIDDGAGGADAAGSGLRGLRDRVEALEGRLTVSSPAGEGTRVRAEFPCA
jgi:signal transduction histidine kinase